MGHWCGSWWCLALCPLVFLSACRSPSGVVQEPPSPASDSTPPARSASARDTTSPATVGSSEGARTLPCGNSMCLRGKERCCTVSKGSQVVRQHCESKTVATPCEPYGSEDMTYRALECENSVDCPGGMCCYTDTSWGLTTVACVAAPDPTSNVCETAEACIGGDSCKTAGTTCRNGVCLDDPHPLTCGPKTCEGDQPICCVKDGSTQPVCAASEEACRTLLGQRRARETFEVFALGCTSRDSCAKGVPCCIFQGASACSADCLQGWGLRLCKNDDECSDGQSCQVPSPLNGRTARMLGLKACAEKSKPQDRGY